MESTQCASCKFFVGDKFCKAFLPNPIPKKVLQGWIIHNHSIEGDGGLRYEGLTVDQYGLIEVQLLAS